MNWRTWGLCVAVALGGGAFNVSVCAAEIYRPWHDSDGKWGLVDTDGRWRVDPSFEYIGDYVDGLYRIEDAGLIGFLSPERGVLISPRFTAVRGQGFCQGWCVVSTSDYPRFGTDDSPMVWFVIGMDGERVSSTNFTQIAGIGDSRALAWRSRDTSEMFVIGPTGDVIWSSKGKPWRPISGPFDGVFVCVAADWRMGICDLAGGLILEPTYDEISPFCEGLAAFRQAGKWGFIATSGAVAVPAVYDQCVGFHDGLAPVKRGERWGAVDAQARVVVPLVYEAVGVASEGLVPVRHSGSWGYLDMTAKVVLPFAFDRAGQFRAGLAIVEQGGNAFLIDRNGHRVNAGSRATPRE